MQARKGSRGAYARMEESGVLADPITPTSRNSSRADELFPRHRERRRPTLHPASRWPAGLPARARRARRSALPISPAIGNTSHLLPRAPVTGAGIEGANDEIHADDECPPRGSGDYVLGVWPKQDLKAHIEFMKRFNKELQHAGELVAAEGLAGPSRRSSCAPGKDGAPSHRRPVPRGEGVPRRLLDRRRRDAGAAYAIAARASAAPGPGGKPLNMPIEVRAGDERAADRAVSSRRATDPREHLLRELAPQVLGAVVRRYGDFARGRRRGAGGADRRRRRSGRARACPTIRAAG